MSSPLGEIRPLVRGGDRSLTATAHIRLRLAVQRLRHRLVHGTAAPRPGRLLWIDPNRVEHVVFPPLHWSRGIPKFGTHILDGGWDRAPLDDDPWLAIRAIKGEEPRRLSLDAYAFTEAIETAPAGFEAFASTWRDQLERLSVDGADEYASMAAAREYYDLYEDIATSGYRTWPAVGHRRPYPEYHEVAVAIGRAGTIYSAGFNKHRLVIARHLDLDAIPVRVHGRHARWQARRAAALEGDTGDSPWSDHPDIRLLAERC